MAETKGEPDFEVDDMPFAIISFEAEKRLCRAFTSKSRAAYLQFARLLEPFLFDLCGWMDRRGVFHINENE